MNEERLQILRLVQEGKVTPEEGAKLLEALDSQTTGQGGGKGNNRWLRVRVMQNGKKAVDLNVPVGLLNVAMRFIPHDRLNADGLDIEEIVTAIREGARGHIVNIHDEEKNTRVEVYVE